MPIHRLGQKGATIFLSLTLPNNRFSKFFIDRLSIKFLTKGSKISLHHTSNMSLHYIVKY